jgi:hypothetical protein
MRITETPDGGLKVWLSANDTYQWATRSGVSRPYSFLRNRRAFAEFDSKGDLVDMAINGGRGDQDCPWYQKNYPDTFDIQGYKGNEFTACMSDHIASKYPNHPALRGEVQPI